MKKQFGKNVTVPVDFDAQSDRREAMSPAAREVGTFEILRLVGVREFVLAANTNLQVGWSSVLPQLTPTIPETPTRVTRVCCATSL